MLAVVVVGLEASWRAWRRSPPGVPAERFEMLLILALIVTLAGGLGLLVGGGRPREILHFVYAIVAVGAVPVADSLARRAAPRQQAVARLIGALVALAVIARLFQTG
ncbi:MAG TPA: hypothetical protein VK194_01345 [Candidatus Deferrimicrobium sp.]|nr:hypothetical protein [Candidatus Deferrimicrobium sp.]